MKELSSFFLGLTQEIKIIAGSIAKVRASEEGASKDATNEPIFKLRSQQKKRKDVEIDSTSNESKQDDGSDSSKPDDNDNDNSEDDNEIFSLALCIMRKNVQSISSIYIASVNNHVCMYISPKCVILFRCTHTICIYIFIHKLKIIIFIY